MTKARKGGSRAGAGRKSGGGIQRRKTRRGIYGGGSCWRTWWQQTWRYWPPRRAAQSRASTPAPPRPRHRSKTAQCSSGQRGGRWLRPPCSSRRLPPSQRRSSTWLDLALRVARAGFETRREETNKSGENFAGRRRRNWEISTSPNWATSGSFGFGFLNEFICLSNYAFTLAKYPSLLKIIII